MPYQQIGSRNQIKFTVFAQTQDTCYKSTEERSNLLPICQHIVSTLLLSRKRDNCDIET